MKRHSQQRVSLMLTERLVPWVNILANSTWIMGVIQIPILKLLNPKATIIPKEDDIIDVWTNGHALMGAILTSLFLGLNIPWWGAILAGNGVMLLYEAYIDGNKLEDPRGASTRDLGANIIGAISSGVAFLIGGIIQKWLL